MTSPEYPELEDPEFIVTLPLLSDVADDTETEPLAFKELVPLKILTLPPVLVIEPPA